MRWRKNRPMRYVIVALIVLVSFASPSPSVDGVDICCVHECCTEVAQPRPVQRFAARLRCALTARLAAMLTLVGVSENDQPFVLDSACPVTVGASLRI